MRREGLIGTGAVLAIAAGLAAVFWVLRGWPDIPVCFTELTPAQEREVAAFKRGSGWLHAAAGVVLAGATWRLAAARRGARRPGRVTVVMLALWVALYVASLVEPGPMVTGVLAWVGFVTFPLGLALAVAALALLAFDRTARAGAIVALVLAWFALTVLVPSHLYAVAYVDDPFCMS